MLYANHRNNTYFSLNKSHLEYMRVVVVVVMVVVVVVIVVVVVVMMMM